MNKTSTISFLNLAPVMAASIFTQGCVGIVTRHMETQTIEPAMIAPHPATFSVVGPGASINEPLIENPAAQWLKQNWGKPSHVEQLKRPAAGERWTYNFDHKWCGFLPWVVVPIPLLLPVGRERVVFYIREGQVVKADVTTLCGYQAVAGWGVEGGFMATSGPWR